MTEHASDCAIHDAPALSPGNCNCGAELAAIDLEPFKILLEHAKNEQIQVKISRIRAEEIIAAVETLRERLERCKDEYIEAVHPEFGTAWRDEWQRAEDAEARVVELESEIGQAIKWQQFYMNKTEAAEVRMAELEGALARLLEFADRTGQGCAKQIEDARAVLSTTPAEALERVRAVGGVLKAAQFFMEDGIAEDSPDLNPVAWQALNVALDNLAALGKEGT